MYGFIDHITGDTKSRKVTRVHAMYNALTSRVVSCNSKRGWTSEDLETICADVCGFKKEIVHCFFFLHIRSNDYEVPFD